MATNRSDIILGVQNKTSQEMRNIGRDLRTTATEATKAERAFALVERSVNGLRESEIRAAQAGQTYGRALGLIADELSRTEKGTERYNALLARQSVVQRQYAAQQSRSIDELRKGLVPETATRGVQSLTSALGGLQQGLGALGIGIGAQQILQFGVNSFMLSQRLQATQQVTQVLSGDLVRYSAVMELARKNQAAFGGTLQENIAQLTSFASTARRTGVNVEELNNLSRRLTVLSPEQAAIGGNTIAINELLSGNVRSLVERFEIDKNLLKGIDESTPTPDKLRILGEALDKMGISLAAVDASSTPAQRALYGLNAEFEKLRINDAIQFGGAVEGVATGLQRLLGLINDNPASIAQLRAILGGRTTVTQGDFDQANAEVARRTTQRQIEQTGVGIFERQGGVFNLFQARDANNYASSVLEGLRPLFDTINQKSPEASAALQGILDRFRDGQLSAPGFSQEITKLYADIQRGIPISQAAAQGIDEQRKALSEYLTTTQKQQELQTQFNSAQETLTKLSKYVSSGLLDQERAAALLAGATGLAADETSRLIAEQSRLSGIQIANSNALNRLDVNAQIEANRKAGRTGRGDSSDAQELEDYYTQRAKDREAALKAQQIATESSAQRVARLNSELGQLTPNTAKYVEKQTELIMAQRQLAAEQQRGARTANTAYNRELRSVEQLRDARFDMLSTEQQLAELRSRLDSGRLSEIERLETIKDIRDLEKEITEQRQRQLESALDARLAALDDRKQRRIEEREAARARSVLASGETSTEQKAAAQDVLERIALEQQKRALEIAEKTRAGGGVAALPGGTVAGAPVAPLPGSRAGLPVAPVAALPGAVVGIEQLVQAIRESAPLVQVYVDGELVTARVVSTLRGGLLGAVAGGISTN